MNPTPSLKEHLEFEKMKMLSVVAFGCHRRAEREIVKLVGRPFIYYEYFLYLPAVRGMDQKAVAKGNPVYAPFLERASEPFPFIPVTEEVTEENIDDYLKGLKEVKFVHSSRDAIRKFLPTPVKVSNLSDTKLNWQAYNNWLRCSETLTTFPRDLNRDDLKHYGIRYERPTKQLVLQGVMFEHKKNKLLELSKDARYKQAIERLFQRCRVFQSIDDLKKFREELSKRRSKNDRIAAYKDFLVTCDPYLRHNINRLHILSYPIASEEMFYGTFILGHQKEDSLNKICETRFERDGMNFLEYLSQEIYLPVLTFFENYWEESVIKVGIDQKKWKIARWRNNNLGLSQNRSAATLHLLFCEVSDKATMLETKLKSLWEYRKGLYPGQRNKLREHLVFTNYNVASPRMLRVVEKVVHLNLKKTDKSMPSALVIGGPGSGKDTLAKLIALFSDEYTKGDIIAINIASYKPEAISTPLIAGLDTTQLKIAGLFSKLPKRSATLVLDELNSLDLDAQGALLRILENGEIIPLGSIKPIVKQINVLVIGVMNEDPEKLTRESTLRQILTQERLFGGALGEVLYEYVRSTRRLREDLYYRLIRGGKIVIPELEKRREDIPILFYVYAKGFSKPFDTIVDLEVYDILMSETIRWPGNIRQLQTLAKEAVNKKLKEGIEYQKPLEITAKDVRAALKAMKILKEEDDELEKEEI